MREEEMLLKEPVLEALAQYTASRLARILREWGEQADEEELKRLFVRTYSALAMKRGGRR